METEEQQVDDRKCPKGSPSGAHWYFAADPTKCINCGQELHVVEEKDNG